jgi:hypothetical protein
MPHSPADWPTARLFRWSGCFPELEASHATLGGHRVLLDGDVVIFDRSGPPGLRRRPDGSDGRRRRPSAPRHSSSGTSCTSTARARALPLRRRRQTLLRPAPRARRGGGASPSRSTDRSLWSCRCSWPHQLEGVIAKRLSSRWQPRRRRPGLAQAQAPRAAGRARTRSNAGTGEPSSPRPRRGDSQAVLRARCRCTSWTGSSIRSGEGGAPAALDGAMNVASTTVGAVEVFLASPGASSTRRTPRPPCGPWCGTSCRRP